VCVCVYQAKIPLQEAYRAAVITQQDLRESRVSRSSRGSQAGNNRMSSGGLGGMDDDMDDSTFGAPLAFSSSPISSRGGPSHSRQSNESGGDKAARERKAWDKSSIEAGHVTLSPHLQSIYAPQDDDDEDYMEDGGVGGGLGGGTSNGTFFSVPALLHGKWVGVLCGRVEMVPLGGVTDAEELDVTKDQLLLWHDLAMRMRREVNKQKCKSGGYASDAASTVQQQVSQSVKVSRRGTAPEIYSNSVVGTDRTRPATLPRFVSGNRIEAHSAETVEAVLQLGGSVNKMVVSDSYFGNENSDMGDVGGRSRKASIGIDLQNQTVILNFNVKRQRVLDKERKCQILQFQFEDEVSDDEEGGDLEHEETAVVKFAGIDSESDSKSAPKKKRPVELTQGLVWMEGDNVVTKDGRRLVLTAELGGPDFSEEERFVCAVTGEGLGGEDDFIVQKRKELGDNGQLLDFFSRTGYLITVFFFFFFFFFKSKLIDCGKSRCVCVCMYVFYFISLGTYCHYHPTQVPQVVR
jgi:hypothetical protein